MPSDQGVLINDLIKPICKNLIITGEQAHRSICFAPERSFAVLMKNWDYN